MSVIQEFQNVAFKDTSFANLMHKREYNVLLIATKYYAFMFEDDGRINEQIFKEYTSLSLRYTTCFLQATTAEEAFDELEKKTFEIFMPNKVDRDIFGTPKEIKVLYPSIPIVVLTPFSKEVSKSIAKQDPSAIDYVFRWLEIITDMDEARKFVYYVIIQYRKMKIEEIFRCFLRAELPQHLIENLTTFFEVVKSPIAIRSSSLLKSKWTVRKASASSSNPRYQLRITNH